MPTPHARPSRRTSTSLAAFAVGLAIAAAGSGCGGGSESSSTPAAAGDATPAATAVPTAPAATGSGPEISFDRAAHDFGRITDIRRYRATFSFTNTGAETLEITKATPSCGCLKVFRETSVFAPGERGAIEVELDPKGKRGAESKHVSVVTNAGGAPITLALSWTVAPLIRLEPPSVRFGVVAQHEPHTRSIKALYVDPQLEIVEVSCPHPNVTAAIADAGAIHARAGDEVTRATTIDVTIDERAPWGSLYGTPLLVSVRATGETPAAPLEHTYRFPLQATVFGEIHARCTNFGNRTSESSSVSVGRVRPGETFEQWAVLRHARGEPFEIFDVTVASSLFPGLEVRTEPEGPAAHRITFAGDPKDYRGHVSATVQVTTSVESEGVLTIRLLGQVR